MKTLGLWVLGAVVALVSGCECTPPVRECVMTRECVAPAPVMECKQVCTPACASTMTTVIKRDAACPALPPVGEICVQNNPCAPRTKMVFVSVRPTDDRCFNPESNNFERPWPWGPNNIGSCSICR
jgi:hypothetical protein